MPRHLKLVIDVVYEYEDGTPLDIHDIQVLTAVLMNSAEHLANEGLLSDEYGPIVSEWKATVEEIR